MGRKSHPQAGPPVSIRLADDLKANLSEAANLLGFSEHDTMRLAMQIGLKHFQAINHDLAQAVLSSSPISPLKQQAPTVKPGQTAPTATSPSNITPLPPQHFNRAAEDGSVDDSPPAQKVSYGSGNGRRKKT